MKKELLQINKNLDYIESRIKETTSAIARLTAAGTTQAKFYIRRDTNPSGELKETYYLLHPMNKGKRIKEYVGRSEVEIKKARERMERFAVRKNLIDTLNMLENVKISTEIKIKNTLELSMIDRLF